MNRRSFLQVLAASTTSYFLAPKCGWKTTEAGLSVPEPVKAYSFKDVNGAVEMVEVLMSGTVILEGGRRLTIRPGERPFILEPNMYKINPFGMVVLQVYDKKEWDAESQRRIG